MFLVSICVKGVITWHVFVILQYNVIAGVVIGVGGEGKDARAINAAMCKLTDYLSGCGY